MTTKAVRYYIPLAVFAAVAVFLAAGLKLDPETFVVDKSGIIRYKHIGPISAEDAEGTILPLIKNLSQSPS